MINALLTIALVAPVIPSYTYCEIRANYVDSVVSEIKAGKTLMHASMLELSKTGEAGIAERMYSGLDNARYSEMPKYNTRIQVIADEIKSECN